MLVVKTSKFYLGKTVIQWPWLNSCYKISTGTQYVLLQGKKFNLLQRTRLAEKFFCQDKLPKLDSYKPNGKERKIPSSSQLTQKEFPKFSRRISRLNKLFMEAITSVITTTDIASQVAGKGFEVTQIRVHHGLTAVYVFWICKDSSDDKSLNEILQKASSFIRFELNTQQILGKIPPIVFIRDDSYRNAVEVENRLKIADFGEEFEPYHHIFQPTPTVIQKEISEEIWKILDEEQGKADVALPLSSDSKYPMDKFPIRQDVFGVNREKIMLMVMKGLKVEKSSDRTSENEDPAILPSYQLEGSFGKSFSPYCSFSRTTEIKKWVELYKKKKVSKTKKNHMEDELVTFARQDEDCELKDDLESFETYDFDEDVYEDDLDYEDHNSDRT